jgi:putative ABC transport system permease protein
MRNFYSAKIESRDYSSTITAVQGLWAKHFPADPFDYFFLDDHFQKQYRSDILFGQVFGFFTLLAILVACLGLFGLASYQALQRRKEIGIRKVLGATATQVTSMLAKEFVRLVLVSIVIAAPLSFFIMQKWLQNFAYRTNIPWWAFVVAAVLAVVIAVVTVSLQSVRAALANPVNALRSE